jgi:glycosyltransferase involved in cell wall biosynthesis
VLSQAATAPRLRVLSIAHNAVASSNRQRAEALAALPGVELTLLSPRWWFEEGRRMEVPASATWQVGQTLATGNGPRDVYLSRLFGLLRRLQPDVIDLVEEPFSLVALQTLLGRDLLARRAALVFYSAVNVQRQWRWPYRAIEQVVLRRADGAHGPNQDVPAILRAKGLGDQPVQTIPLGVDPARFVAEAVDDGGPLPTLEGAVSLERVPRPRVGFVGRLEPVKGLDVLLDAFEQVPAPATLLLAGDGPERRRLRLRADGYRVRLLPALAYTQVPNFLRRLDVLVLPSVTILPHHREQFGRVLVEAMAAGVPVIGSSSGAIPEVIGDAGLVVPERDPAALAEALRRLLGDATLQQQLIARGQARVAQRFAWPVVAEQTLDLFRAALAHRRSVSPQLQEVGA